MPKELSNEVTIKKLKLARNVTLDQVHRALALARTSVPGEVRAKYLRQEGISTVHTDVRVDAVGEAGMKLRAVVHVELTYKGDMVRSSPAQRDRINRRLQELAQKHVAVAVAKEIAERLTR